MKLTIAARADIFETIRFRFLPLNHLSQFIGTVTIMAAFILATMKTV